jgi:hypothetical protein
MTEDVVFGAMRDSDGTEFRFQVRGPVVGVYSQATASAKDVGGA